MESKETKTRPPGSDGEHEAQENFGSRQRAEAFYNNQMLDFLNPLMKKFISEREMVFISTSESKGECDSSFRAGAPGFVHILNKRKLALPEYRGNGVMASIGNIMENPHIGMFFIDFFSSRIGLHINGHATIIDNESLIKKRTLPTKLLKDAKQKGGRKPECWIMIQVEEAYIHCSKHIPKFKKLKQEIHWGTDNEIFKGGDAFKAKSCIRPWVQNSQS